MSEILVTYASKHGHTGKIAARIARAAAEAGASVELRDVEGAAHVDLADYDAVVVGSSIHAGKHSREIIDWAREHHAALNALPSAFFTVCLSAAEDTAEARRATTGYLDDFLQATGWTPATTATFAGALQYREYDFMTRLLMRLLMHKGGHPTDTSRDYEYTDWAAVAEFGKQCAALAAEPAAQPTA